MKIRDPDLSANAINQEHLKAGLPPLETLVTEELRHPHLVWAAWAIGIILVSLVVYLAGQFVVINGVRTGEVLEAVFTSSDFWSAAGVGFVAQMIDGALGMAYGISATTFLLSTGATPAVASASVHIAEVFTTGLSGISHVRLGNVNRELFLRLLVPGIVGATVGVVVVTQVDGKAMKPFISAYLLLMGMYILWRAYHRRTPNHEKPRHVAKLALFGGFVDAAGGGGWGPVVTTSLVGSGHDPRTTIGSVNFAEFFLTLSTAASFSALITASPWITVGGLVFGGLFAAPFAAVLCSRIPARTLMTIVGLVITFISVYNLNKALG
jgi:uncharacterized membrane protein YfcA